MPPLLIEGVSRSVLTPTDGGMPDTPVICIEREMKDPPAGAVCSIEASGAVCSTEASDVVCSNT
jgi:hypothetical protein